MIIDFKGLLEAMEDDEIFTLANESRPGENYLWNDVLPDTPRRGYSAKAGNMTINSTMSKMVGMDSPFPRAGTLKRQSFEHKIAKFALEMPFPEEYLRELRELVNDQFNNTIDGHEEVLETMFNFTQKLMVQPHWDSAEHLKSIAIITGEIDIQTDDIRLQVDYGIPAENFLTPRSGNDAYGGSTSKFWTDWHEAQRILKNKVQAVYCNTKTLQTIMYNPVNNLKVVAADQNGGFYTFQRYIVIGGNTVVSEDVRDRITIITYDDSADVLDETKLGTGMTKLVPFCPDGALVFIGQYDTRRFQIGSGSTDESTIKPVTIGYNHIGPTEEGNGRIGMWANAFVPEGKPWSFVAQSVINMLPVIEAPDRIVNATTTL